jgi:hypothetical protein
MPIEIDDTGEDIQIELNVFDVPKVLGEGFGRQGFSFSLTVFVPSTPPTFNVLSLIDPWFFHSLHCIGTFPLQSHWCKFSTDQIEPKWRHEKTNKINFCYKLLIQK